ncbi:hypothetical protein [Mesorhizobium amorphae]|uniref:hypothetical protein n=1 Tax=Mesorhizobium amorphae TaxID=71433 RepID=UPI00177CC866|nr:hypothetical protein [Mesorhizobium amorphae]
MPLRYAVETCPDDATVLHLKLNEAVDNGGRVVNVIWQPEHEVVDRSTYDDVRIKVDAAYVIILEYFEAEP